MIGKMFLGVCACFLALVAVASAGTENQQLSHAIFVKVNGKTITQDNVVQAAEYLIKREYNDVVPEDEEELQRIEQAALRDLIRTILIHDSASSLGIKVDRNYSRRAIAQSGLEPALVTPTIRRMLEADDLFEDIMMAEGTPIGQPSPREMKKFYSENREDFRSNAFIIVRTIFIGEDGIKPQSFFKRKAEELMAEIQAVPLAQRADYFARKAKTTSDDVFKEFGGLLTGDAPERWIPKDFENRGPDGGKLFPEQMVEGIHKLARPGEVRLAVSADGMHLLYCEDMRGGQIMSWDDAARIIEYVLTQRKKNERMRAWLSRVYDRSDVRWHDGSKYEKEMLTRILLPSERTKPL